MRIVAGRFKGRRINAPDGRNAVRPTTDKVREAVFNILMRETPGARVLDLFCGTGALAIESLSRGAEFALCADRDTRIAQSNAELLGIGEKEIAFIRGDFRRTAEQLAAKGERFDLIFIDPPYKSDYDEILPMCARLCAADGMLVVEHDATLTVNVPTGFDEISTRKYGECAVTFIKAAEGEE